MSFPLQTNDGEGLDDSDEYLGEGAFDDFDGADDEIIDTQELMTTQMEQQTYSKDSDNGVPSFYKLRCITQ